MNDASVFFIEKQSNKYEFDTFPSDLYVDTCFWNNAFSNGNASTRYHTIEFLKNSVSNGTNLYSSVIVENEIINVAKQTLIKQEVKKNNMTTPRFNDGKVNFKKLFEVVQAKNPSIVPQITSKISFILESINEISEKLPLEFDDEFSAEVLKVLEQSNYIIGSIDAQHIVLAHRYGINSIATADGDYWMLDNANLYVPYSEKYQIARLDRRNVSLKFSESIY